MIEIIEFVNVIFLCYGFCKFNLKNLTNKEEVKDVDAPSSLILYQVIVKCKVTERDYPSTLIFKNEQKAEDYKYVYASALIKENIFKTQSDFDIRIENLKAIL
jgi:hypothetical protein